MISWFLWVPARVPGLVSLLFFSFFSQERDSVPSWFPWFLLVPAQVPGLVSLLFFLFSGKGFCSIMISWFFSVPARVQVLVSILLSFSPNSS